VAAAYAAAAAAVAAATAVAAMSAARTSSSGPIAIARVLLLVVHLLLLSQLMEMLPHLCRLVPPQVGHDLRERAFTWPQMLGQTGRPAEALGGSEVGEFLGLVGTVEHP